MNLRQAILEEHSRKQCVRMVQYISGDPEKFAELMALFFGSDRRITQRAAWPMSECCREHPRLIHPYLNRLIRNLERTDLHDAAIRNTLRLLQFVDIPKRYHGRLMNACFTFAGIPGTPVAIKAFALTILQHFSQLYPEILPELRLLVQDQWHTATAAFRQRAKKII